MSATRMVRTVPTSVAYQVVLEDLRVRRAEIDSEIRRLMAKQRNREQWQARIAKRQD